MYPESKLGIESLLSRGDSRAKKEILLVLQQLWV